MNKLKIDLNKPYPFPVDTKDKIGISVFFGAFVFFFLLIFQPFNIDDIPSNKPLIIFGFGLITLFVFCVSLFLLPKLFSSYFDTETWIVKKSIYLMTFIWITVAVFNWGYSLTLGKEIISQPNSLLYSVFITGSVGVFPLIFIIMLSEQILSKQNNVEAEKITDTIAQHNLLVHHQTITNIELGDKNNSLMLTPEQLICVKSDGNYSEIYYYQNNEVKKSLVRSSLAKMKEQLASFENIKHCHRSYIVNFQHLNKVTGNARNYNLHLNQLDFTVPVSRNFSRAFLENIKV